MCKECEEKAAVLSPEELDSVSGGRNYEGQCYFVPEIPYKKMKIDNILAAKCISRCYDTFGVAATCSCYNSPRCVDRYHRMEDTQRSTWKPFPIGENNHSASDKHVPSDP